jgi:hypothetical protein
MDVQDFYQMLEKSLLGKITLQEFADELSKSWLSEQLFFDPYRSINDNSMMNRVLFNIIENVFESGEIYNPELLKKGAHNLIGDAEFKKDILTAYTRLIIFLYKNPEYMFFTDKY